MGREKVKTLDQLEKIIDRKRARGKTIVFTNGCFDILHIGHIRLLEDSKKQGDILIAAINSDASVRKLKGFGRPIVCEEDRAEMLSAMECVDYIVIFNEETPVETIRRLKPDIHIKGGDYDIKSIPEAEIVRSYGGKLKSFKFISGHSSTGIIERILQIEKKDVT